MSRSIGVTRANSTKRFPLARQVRERDAPMFVREPIRCIGWRTARGPSSPIKARRRCCAGIVSTKNPFRIPRMRSVCCCLRALITRSRGYLIARVTLMITPCWSRESSFSLRFLIYFAKQKKWADSDNANFRRRDLIEREKESSGSARDKKSWVALRDVTRAERGDLVWYMRRDDKRSQRARRCCESDTAGFAASKKDRLDGAYDLPGLQGPIAEELPGSVAMVEDKKTDGYTRRANMAARRRLSRGGEARAVSDANCALSIFFRDIYSKVVLTAVRRHLW